MGSVLAPFYSQGFLHDEEGRGFELRRFLLGGIQEIPRRFRPYSVFMKPLKISTQRVVVQTTFRPFSFSLQNANFSHGALLQLWVHSRLSCDEYRPLCGILLGISSYIESSENALLKDPHLFDKNGIVRLRCYHNWSVTTIHAFYF
jgi:hypothetical protein